MTYTVQPGDSPGRIAQKLTGNPGLAWQLTAANPSSRGGLLVGQQLNVPAAWGQYGGGLGRYATARNPQAVCPPGMAWFAGNAFTGAGCYPRQAGVHGVGAPGSCTWQRWTGQVALANQGAALYAALQAAPQGVIPFAAVPAAPAVGPLSWQTVSAWGYTWGLRTLNGFETLFVCVPTNLRIARSVAQSFGVGDVNSIALELQMLNNQASTPITQDTDGSYHGYVSGLQTAGAAAVGGLGPDLDATYAQYSGYNNSATQSAWQANANLQALNSADGTSATPAQLSDAQNAQQTLQQMAAFYGTASSLGQSAAAAGGGTPPTSTSQYNAATVAAAQAIMQSTTAALCNLGGSSSGNSVVNNFQTTYNTSTGVKPLATDGKYGPLTQAAAAVVLIYNGGGVPPRPCTSYTNGPGGAAVTCPAGQTLVSGQCVNIAPAACGSGQVPDSVTGKCVAACPAGQLPANGVCIAGPVVAPSGGTVQASNGPLIAGVILVVLGAGAVAYGVEKKKGHRRARARRR